MKEIFQEYGGVLITVAAMLGIIAVMAAVIGSDETSIIGQAFSDLVSRFIDTAGSSAGLTAVP